MVEKEEKRDEKSGVLVSLEEVYTPISHLKLCVINEKKDKIKDILTSEISQLDNECSLLDVLSGNVETDIDEATIEDMRKLFKFTKQIGFVPAVKYDFFAKSDRKKLYSVEMLKDIQNTYNITKEFNEF